MMKHILGIAVLSLSVMSCTGKQNVVKETLPSPNYATPLPAGEAALKRVPFQNWPDVGAAWESRDLFLQDSIDNSISWFDAPSSTQWFPIEGVTHEQAKNSVVALRSLLATSTSKEAFIAEVQKKFHLYQSVGYDGDGTVLFTGYYSPDFRASKTQSAEFNSPLYQRPHTLVTDPATGEPLGRLQNDGTIATWPTRKELETSGELVGTELVWVKDALDAYTIHVNGSARLRLDDGKFMYIGYAGKTDRPYTGLGHSVLEAGLLAQDKLSLRAIRRLFDSNTSQITKLIHKNDSFVFFQEYNGDTWPAGSLGVPVTAQRSVATDKKIFPRGGIVLVDTTIRSLTGAKKTFTQFMTDQDTGGAIRAPGRADLFMGVGPTAGIKAGGQYAEGQLYYLFLQPESVALIQD